MSGLDTRRLLTPGGRLCLGLPSEELGARIRFQFDLRADEQDEQAKEADTEESEQTDDRIGNKAGNQPADGGHNMSNEPAGHQSAQVIMTASGVVLRIIIRPIQKPVNMPGRN